MSLLLSLFVFLLCIIPVNADAKSDFDYQYSKHRENYLEYTLYKKDYLSNPTLDNQQKALLSAKQSTNTRELTRASFAALLRDLISINKLNNYALSDELNSKLLIAQQFFLTESQKTLAVVTLSDLDIFNQNYQLEYPKHERYLKAGIVGHKLSRLKYFANRQNEALTDLKSKIPNTVSVRVFERLDSLETELIAIHKKIDSLSEYLISDESLENTQNEVFFTSRIEFLAEIRSLQLIWMDKLIDLDLNYAKI